MLYSNYLQDKYHNAIKFSNSEGVPCALKHSKGEDIKNYEVHGNSIQGRNLLPYPYYHTTRTTNGVTFTDNGDGSVTVNGTATAYTTYFFYLNQNSLMNGLKIGDAVAISIVSDKTWASSPTTMIVAFNYYDSTGVLKSSGVSANSAMPYKTTIIGNNWVGMGMYIAVYKDRTVDNITLRVQVERGTDVTEYQNPIISIDNPIEIESVGDLTTKNLLLYPYRDTTKKLYGITFTDNDGTITLDGTTTLAETGVVDFVLLYQATLKAGTYTLSGCPKTGATYTYRLFVNIKHNDNTYAYANDFGNGSTFTVTDTDLVTITIRIGGQLGTVSNLVFKPQLELGSTATEYAPYDKYDIPVTISGKNLFDVSKILSGSNVTNNGDGTIVTKVGAGSAPAPNTLHDYCPELKVGDVVTLNYNATAEGGDITNAQKIYLYGANMAWFIGTTKAITQSMLDSRVAWYPARDSTNTYYYATISDIQMELGMTATSYEPYKGSETTHIYLDEPLRKIGDCADYIDFKNQKIVRNIKEITLNGSENWRLQGTNENGIISFIYSISNETAPSTTSISALSTHYSYKTSSLSNTTEQGFFVQRGAGVTNIYIRMLNEDIADIAAFKTWLSENNVTVYYQMATPTEESISLPILHTLKNTNIMSVDTSIRPINIKTKYIRK